MSKKRKTWRCFHCDEVFRGVIKASLHFGDYQNATPACQIDIVRVRETEALLARYREEDTDLHRRIARMETEHGIALRRAEEAGYAKGLQDGRNLQNP